MNIIDHIDSETLALSGVIIGSALPLANDHLETLAKELSWRRPRGEKKFSLITNKQAPRFAIYGK